MHPGRSEAPPVPVLDGERYVGWNWPVYRLVIHVLPETGAGWLHLSLSGRVPAGDTAAGCACYHPQLSIRNNNYVIGQLDVPLSNGLCMSQVDHIGSVGLRRFFV